MGTRSLTVVKTAHDDTVCALYRQYNGHPDGMGKDLYEILKPCVLVHGLSGQVDTKAKKHMNGVGELALHVIWDVPMRGLNKRTLNSTIKAHKEAVGDYYARKSS